MLFKFSATLLFLNTKHVWIHQFVLVQIISKLSHRSVNEEVLKSLKVGSCCGKTLMQGKSRREHNGKRRYPAYTD